MGNNAELLTMRDIHKEFPGVKALSGVDFTLKHGEIHALLGENGAGKSTLIKVLTGVEKSDGGEIKMEGKRIAAKTPLQAQEAGISTVYQEVNLCPNLSVAENIFVGRELMKKGRIDWKTINSRAKALMEQLDIQIDVTQTLDNYSVALQQMVAIARALDINAKVLILDEPTSSLDANEVGKLFQVMRKLRGNGVGIVFVTHFLDQVYAVSDRITILRNGELIGEYEAAALPKTELIGKMIGKEYEVLQQVDKKTSVAEGEGDIFIKAEGMRTFGIPNPIDVQIKKGEVLGLAGLLGSGRSEVARALFGADKMVGGTLMVDGKTKEFSKPIDAIHSGVSYCPEDRKSEGIVADLTIRENIVLALQAKKGMFHYISIKEQQKIVDQYIKLLQIKTPSGEQLIKNLSGGNQQKVILARWLATEPSLLMMDEPTRGIDVGTKAEIQKLVIELASQGKAMIFISSEIDEMLRCCSRMIILSDKEKLGELSGDEIDEHAIMTMIAGGGKHEATH